MVALIFFIHLQQYLHYNYKYNDSRIEFIFLYCENKEADALLRQKDSNYTIL